MPFGDQRRGTAATDGRELSVFWDYQNLPLPSWAKPADAAKAIVQAVSKHGRIVDRRLYFDMAAGADGNNMWSALDSSGFDLVNTPRRNQKETLDKKLIADVLTFAWDSAVRSNDDCKPCVVLLTSDGDYAYTLSKLRDRGVMSVVMYGNDSTAASLLKSSADIPLSFEKDVLSPFVNQQQNGSNSNNNSRSASSDDLLQTNPIDNAKILCAAVAKDLVKDTTHGTWILGSKVAVSFRTSFLQQKTGSATTTVDKFVIKEIYRKAREVAVKNGWLVHGRRSLQGPTSGQIVAPPSDGTAGNPQYWSLEDFLKVTLKGKVLAENSAKTAANTNDFNNNSNNNSGNQTNSANLFVKNVPTNSRIKDLVQYLEQEFSVVIVKGYTKKMHPNAQYMFASIQVETVQMGEHLCRSAGANRIKLNNRTLEVCFDRNVKSYSGPSEHYYERNANASSSSSSVNKQRLSSTSADSMDDGDNDKVYKLGIDRDGNNTKLFLKNVPRCNINELVQYLEQEHQVHIIQANVQKAHPKSSFQFAHVVVGSKDEAERLLAISGKPQFKMFERIMNVSYELSEKSYCGSKGDPDGYYERPASERAAANQDDDITTLCKIIRARMVQQHQLGTDGLPDGWFEGGGVADAFHTLIDKKKGKGCQMSEQAKERFKKARADAANQKRIEVGRRLKVGPRTGDINPVGFKCDTSRYSGEIYIRLAQNVTGTDSSGGSASAAETKNLFVLGLPVGTDIRTFVTFLETSYKCVVQRAMLVAAKLNLCSAHIELATSQEAANLLQVAISGTGVTFGEGRLAISPDLRVPTFSGNDLTRLYEASNDQPVPATIVSVPRTVETCSVSGDTQSQESTEDSQVDVTLEFDDEALLCRVLYEQCVNSNGFDSENPDYSQWKAMGSAGSDFQGLFLKRFSSDEAKQRFKTTRENGIAEGLVEMGRRDLRSPTKEVVLVPFYSYGQGSSNTSLSLDSYLRLTMKGIWEAEKVPMLKKAQQRPSASKSKNNAFLTNLPRSLEIQELVDYLEHTYKITIKRAAVDPVHPMAKTASAHVEFQTDKDLATIASVDRDRRLVYAGKALRLVSDRKIPNWATVDPRFFYERKDVKNPEEEENNAQKKYAVNDSIFTGTDASTDLNTTFDTSNMLFGDNLSLLYPQEMERTSGLSFEIDSGDPKAGVSNMFFPSHTSYNDAGGGLGFTSADTKEATDALGFTIPEAADLPPFEATDLSLNGASSPFAQGPSYKSLVFPLIKDAAETPQEEPVSRPSLVPTEASSEVSPVEGLAMSPMESPELSQIQFEANEVSPLEAPGLPAMESLVGPSNEPDSLWS
ncbi:Pfam:DUF88 [Seminavis robusta]|uniref:Pfam:DUF88 n=1 Tax=Seminavis robusta TaxID=568900 RepID=A0A9N8HBX2_9STRA|nr:Pfam:DUF88 [Seminavis robusta]|eukprot:Sro276_g105960.1 Pfam:DUF88 (1322) ;mRNA; r:28569-32534